MQVGGGVQRCTGSARHTFRPPRCTPHTGGAREKEGTQRNPRSDMDKIMETPTIAETWPAGDLRGVAVCGSPAVPRAGATRVRPPLMCPPRAPLCPCCPLPSRARPRWTKSPGQTRLTRPATQAAPPPRDFFTSTLKDVDFLFLFSN